MNVIFSRLIAFFCTITAFYAFRISKLGVHSSVGELLMNAMNDKYPLQNDLMVRAARGEKVERTPIWIFRQAGRHLPEYNEYKKTTNKNFLELLDDPADVTECTMQPIRRYDLDAAILFSDILVILQAYGIEVSMPGGVGIQVPEPLANPSEIYSRLPSGKVDVHDKLSHVITAVTSIKEELKGKVPLIGFSAAPWTLMYYMVGGSSKKNQRIGQSWLDNHPEESQALLDMLTDTVIDYMSAQIDAGADMIQVFEAMGEFVNDESFYKWCIPSLSRIATELKSKHPNVPLLVFPRGATYALKDMQRIGYDVVTLDTQTNRQEIRAILKEKENLPSSGKISVVQGNLDVSLLKAGESSVSAVEAGVKTMLEELGPHKLIANLGEGLTGQEDPEYVNAFVESVHKISEEMM